MAYVPLAPSPGAGELSTAARIGHGREAVALAASLAFTPRMRGAPDAAEQAVDRYQRSLRRCLIFDDVDMRPVSRTPKRASAHARMLRDDCCPDLDLVSVVAAKGVLLAALGGQRRGFVDTTGLFGDASSAASAAVTAEGDCEPLPSPDGLADVSAMLDQLLPPVVSADEVPLWNTGEGFGPLLATSRAPQQAPPSSSPASTVHAQRRQPWTRTSASHS